MPSVVGFLVVMVMMMFPVMVLALALAVALGGRVSGEFVVVGMVTAFLFVLLVTPHSSTEQSRTGQSRRL